MSRESLVQPLSYIEASAEPQLVAVTGCTGFVASFIVERLLACGFVVHGTDLNAGNPLAPCRAGCSDTPAPGTCRTPEDKDKIEHLLALPGAESRLKLFKADLNDGPKPFEAAFKGCAGVIHTASPVYFSVPKEKAQEILIGPAIAGVRSVLTAVSNTPTVIKVIMTSSVAALHGDPEEHGKGAVIDSTKWNKTSDEAHLPYNRSKTLAEQLAWELAGQQKRYTLVTVLPALVLGPPMSANQARTAGSSVTSTIGPFLKGLMWPAAPPFGWAYVDARDCAAVHVRALLYPGATGRYICATSSGTMDTWGGILGKKYALQPFLKMPKLVMRLLAPFFGAPQAFITCHYNKVPKYDTGKLTRELSLVTPIPLERSLLDAAGALVDLGVYSAPNPLKVAVPLTLIAGAGVFLLRRLGHKKDKQ